MRPLLEVKNLNVSLKQGKKRICLEKDVSFQVEEGMCLGILGESGSGKSIAMKAVLGLLDRSFEISGEANFDGRDLITMEREALRRIRGNEISVILQNPMTCFDPLYRIGAQMAETFREHGNPSRETIHQKAVEILLKMQIHNPEEVLKKYPHQLSGGMLQRIMIGLAIAMEPKLIVADEPTTAIDSVTQYEIIEELLKIKKSRKCAILFVSHDIGVISKMADQVIVMHKASVVDRGTLEEIRQNTKDPYTKTLFSEKMAVLEHFNRIMGGISG